MDILACLNKNGEIELYRISYTIQNIFPAIHDTEGVLDFHFSQDSQYFIYLTEVNPSLRPEKSTIYT